MTTTDEKGSTMDYQEAVAAAAVALERGDDADWELARLTYEYTRSGGGPQIPDGLATMEQWCADIRARSGRRFSSGTGRLYKAAWRWRLDNSPNSSELPMLNDVLRRINPDSRDPATVQARVDAAAVEKLLRTGTPEAKRDVFERLRADPDVIAPTLSLVPEPAATPHGDLPPRGPSIPEPVTVARGALRLAVFISDARVAAQHYAQTLGEIDLDAAGREAEAEAIDGVLRVWERLRLIINAPGGIRVVEEVEDFLADARA